MAFRLTLGQFSVSLCTILVALIVCEVIKPNLLIPQFSSKPIESFETFVISLGCMIQNELRENKKKKLEKSRIEFKNRKEFLVQQTFSFLLLAPITFHFICNIFFFVVFAVVLFLQRKFFNSLFFFARRSYCI